MRGGNLELKHFANCLLRALAFSKSVQASVEFSLLACNVGVQIDPLLTSFFWLQVPVSSGNKTVLHCGARKLFYFSSWCICSWPDRIETACVP